LRRVANHRASQTTGTPGHCQRRIPKTDQSQHTPGHALLGVHQRMGLAEGSSLQMALHRRQFACQRQQQRHRMVGLLFDAEMGYIGDQNALLGRCDYVDLVYPGAQARE
jgi:stress-induced morphogen